MSDPTGKGYLEKTGFFVALKLISLAQNGQDPAVSKLTLDAPQPNLVCSPNLLGRTHTVIKIVTLSL